MILISFFFVFMVVAHYLFLVTSFCPFYSSSLFSLFITFLNSPYLLSSFSLHFTSYHHFCIIFTPTSPPIIIFALFSFPLLPIIIFASFLFPLHLPSLFL